MPLQKTVLAADDDPVTRYFIDASLKQKGFRVIHASTGRMVLDLLEEHGDQIQAILLDWIMPETDGLETLRTIKKNSRFQDVPVIMQTVRDGNDDITRGIHEGAFYYLTKPYDKDVFVSVVESAIAGYERIKCLVKKIEDGHQIGDLLFGAVFRFRTLQEADNLAHWLAHACPDPRNAILGLSELFVNSIEHGNLGIDYDEKGELLLKGAYRREIQRRLNMPEYSKRYVEAAFEKDQEKISVHIKDQGDGFEFERFLKLDPDRIFDNHGKGILMARMLYFDDLQYMGCGNEVTASVKNDRADEVYEVCA